MTSPSDPAKPPAAPPTTREIATPDPRRTKGLGKKYIAVIGIDRYRAWPQLSNAVTDAQGALKAFTQLGFESVRPPLLDDAATGAALHRLVTDELSWLGTDDSLVVFFAGHGHTVTTRFGDGTLTKKGYLIPVDAESDSGKSADCIKLDSWLGELTLLPPRHILVILDACHSGVALDPVIRWRGEDVRAGEPFETLRTRRSRRIITSALDNQLAMDSGPIDGHSLFTGCLIEALTGGFVAKTGQTRTTGSELGVYVQRRVTTYPSSTQTPDFGALQFDNRGELIIELPELVKKPPPPVRHGAETIRNRSRDGDPASQDVLLQPVPAPRKSGAHDIRSRPAPQPVDPPRKGAPVERDEVVVKQPLRPEPPPHEHVEQTRRSAHRTLPDVPASGPRSAGPPLDAAFVAMLERHEAERQRKRNVLTVVAADPTTAVTGWATWAAKQGRLTLVTDATGQDAVVSALLAQMPWLRTLPTARGTLAGAARVDANAVDRELDARASHERETWIDNACRHDLHARVSGWLLSALREPWAQVPDLKTSPVRGLDLLTVLCDLAVPITILLHHAEPTAAWLEQAIQTAYDLVCVLPRYAIAISAPDELINQVMRTHTGSPAVTLARQGKVQLAARNLRLQDRSRSHSELTLREALANDPRTRGLFEPNAPIPVYDRSQGIEVDLVARDALLAVEIDDWYQFRDPQAYHRERIKDVWLQRAGFFVMRFLVEDVEERLPQTVDEIALGLAGRRASGSFVEKV